MNKEIDLRSIIFRNLKCEAHDIKPISLCENKTINLLDRPFENNRKWSIIEQTSYIESIFLHCSLQPIIRFKNPNHTIIVDGFNRYLAIKQFYNNELVLHDKGLKQLKFLKGKKFSDLTEKEFQYFSKCDPIKVFDYSYSKNDKLFLLPEEEIEVLKYLYVVYNTGLRLLIEEIQKAQFSSDYLTNKIRERLNNDEKFIDIAENLRLFNGRRKRSKIDNILLNCRLLIASTYSNINSFCSTGNIEMRIEKNYLPNIVGKDLDKIYHDFTVNIDQIYNNLICTQKWAKYEILHSKPFLDATYWLISVIRKDKLGDPFVFDFMSYLEYFGEREEKERNFNPFQAHYKRNIYNKYYVVAEYYEEYYGVDMSRYFEEVLDNDNQVDVINSIEELYNRQFSFQPEKVVVSDLITNFINERYILRPFYQREEVMNVALASKVIESLLLGIEIPYILVCDKYKDGKLVTEVVDGQQRILAILGYLMKPFMNENGEIEYSNKNGYALKDLRILHELNGVRIEADNKEFELSKENFNKILNSHLYISRTRENDNSRFSAVDHFVRLNKNICTLKENTYRMWYLTSDSRIIDYAEKITHKYIEKILPKMNKKNSSNMITLKLANLFYHTDLKDINLRYYNNVNVSNWLKNFNILKCKYMYKDYEKIEVIRRMYLDSIDMVGEFYYKLDCFLESIDKGIRDLVSMNQYANIPLSNYYYLYCMLKDISRENLIDNASSIFDIIKDFFAKIKADRLDNQGIILLLNQEMERVIVFEKRYEFKRRIGMGS